MLPNRDGADVLRVVRLEIEYVDLVIWNRFPLVGILDLRHRVGDQGDVPSRAHGKIGRRPEDRVLKCDICHDPRVLPIGDLDERDGIFAGWQLHDLPGIVPLNLLVVARQEYLRPNVRGRCAEQCGSETDRDQELARLKCVRLWAWLEEWGQPPSLIMGSSACSADDIAMTMRRR